MFITNSESGKFLNAQVVKDRKLKGKIATITGEGEFEELEREGEKTKTVWNVPIEVKIGKEILELTYSPNKTNRDIWTDAWGVEQKVDGVMQKGLETKEIIGKQFKISLAKVNFRGKLVDSVVTEPIVEDEDDGEDFDENDDIEVVQPGKKVVKM